MRVHGGARRKLHRHGELQAGCGGVAVRRANLADNVTGSPQKVPLSGTGTVSTAQEIDLTPGSVIFGDVTVGQTSTPQPLLIANPGAMVLDFNGSYITGPDAADFLKSTQCGLTVPPYGNCTITLNFRPAATGLRSAIFYVSDSGVHTASTDCS